MEHRPLSEIRNKAHVVVAEAPSRATLRMLRRERLERFATVLEQYSGPMKPLSRIEYLSAPERMLLRSDGSPLSIAYRDSVLRGQGLESDRFGDAVAFFDLTQDEAHHLFCDCHYANGMTSQRVATRVRAVARRMSLGEVWGKIVSMIKLH